MSASARSETLTVTVDGARILAACRYDHRLAGAIIALQDNYSELLDSIKSPELIKNTAHVVAEIRAGLGLECDAARRLSNPDHWR